MSIEIIVSADEVRYLTENLRTKILRSDVENWEKCVEDLEKIVLITKKMDEIITAMTSTH